MAYILGDEHAHLDEHDARALRLNAAMNRPINMDAAGYLPREQADEPAWAISEHSSASLPPSRGWKTWTLIATAFALLAAILFWPGFYEHWPRAVSWLFTLLH